MRIADLALHQAVEFGEYEGVVRVPWRLFQRLVLERPTPERCVEAYYLQRARFERIAERKLRQRLLRDEGLWFSRPFPVQPSFARLLCSGPMTP
jgi:hypothetical protein